MSNTYVPMLHILQDKFGGKVTTSQTHNPRAKSMYQWNCYGKNALNCVSALLPHLIEKREQAELMLEYRNYPKGSEERKAIFLRCRELKHLSYKSIESQEPE